MDRYRQLTGKPNITSCESAALELPLAFDPGAAWAYGINFEWIGKAVEAVSGKTLGAYMSENLFAPLGMHDTVFRIRDDQRGRLARVHTRGSQGIVATDFEVPQKPEFELGGGGLYSTVGDYLRFARMILRGGALEGTRVLSASTVAAMSANAMGELRCRPLKSAAPTSSNDIDFIDGMVWGLGFLIIPGPMPTGRSAGSLAWAGFANSFFWIDPTKNVAGVYQTQLLPFLDAECVALFQAFEKAVYAMS